MADLPTILEKIVPPILTGMGGVAATLIKLAKGLEDRVTKLEEWRSAQYATDMRTLSGELANVRTHYDGAIKAVKASVDTDLNELGRTLRARDKEQREARILQTRLSERAIAIEGRIEACERAIAKLDADVADASKEQQEQWQNTARLLGTLEGYLRAGMRSRPDYPPPQLKK